MTATTDFQDDFIPYKSGGTFFKICLICSSNPIMLGHDSGFRDSGLDPYNIHTVTNSTESQAVVPRSLLRLSGTPIGLINTVRVWRLLAKSKAPFPYC